MSRKKNLDYFLNGLHEKRIEVLAQAITLVESRNPEHQKLAQELIREILPLTGKSQRIGISGTPGVGKSTFLDNFGYKLVQNGERIAILAVDPTSQITGGSILGDKTRMQKLTQSDFAFIRPSPNGETLGGVAAKTRESMLLCEAFGFDTIFIETVGVGQSEIAVSNIVDYFILLMQPGGGDELQGIKRGILEVCNLVVVNKADGDQDSAAKIAKHDFERSLAVLKEHSDFKTPVILCSSIEGRGFDEINLSIEQFFTNEFDSKTRDHKVFRWMEELIFQKIQSKVKSKIRDDQRIKKALKGEANLIDTIDEIAKEIIK